MSEDKTPPSNSSAEKREIADGENHPITKESILEALMPIQDPEIRIGVVDLGLIYDVLVENNSEVTVKMTLTTPACPYGEMLVSQVQKTAKDFPGVTEAKVDLVWEPMWDPREMASDYAKDLLGIW